MSSIHGKPYVFGTSAKRFRLRNLPSTMPAPEPLTQDLPAEVEFDLGLDKNIELPTTSPLVANKPYRYAYGVHEHRAHENDPPVSLANAIIKLDVHTCTAKFWMCEGSVPGEPIFVPGPGASGKEDEGVLLTVALDGEKGTSALVVLDAETMTEVARAEMTIPFPFGFHVSAQVPLQCWFAIAHGVLTGSIHYKDLTMYDLSNYLNVKRTRVDHTMAHLPWVRKDEPAFRYNRQE
jgi:hypothetical protein